MKKALLFLAVLFAGFTVWAQVTGKIDFKTLTYNFGKIKHNVPVDTEFSFVNNTGKPVIIKSAIAECGCTEPAYDKKPIANGKTSTIKVTYKADTPGSFNKKITVSFVNIKDPVILNISGEVAE